MSTNTVDNKRIAKNTLMLYLRMFLTMGISLYTSRVVLQVLGVSDYGINNVVGGLVVMFTFLNNTMAVSTQRFLAYDLGSLDPQRVNATFNVAMQIHLCVAIGVFILAESVGLWFLHNYMVIPEERMDAAIWVYQFAILGLGINMTQVPYTASIIANERMNIFAYLSLLDSSLKLGVVFLLYYGDFDKLKLYAALNFSMTVLTATVYRIYCIRNFPECKLHIFRLHKEQLKSMLGYAGWNMSNHLALIARTQGVNILINLFFGPTMNAARAISVQVNTAVSSFVTNFQQAMNPQIVKSYASGNTEAKVRLIMRGARYSFYLLFLISFPLMLEMDYILHLWLGQVPDAAPVFCRLALASALVDALSGPVGYGALATGRVKVYQLTMSGFFILVPLMTYLGYKSGMPAYTCLIVELLSYMAAIFVRPLLLSRLVVFPVREFARSVSCRCFSIVLLAIPIPLYLYTLLPAQAFGSFLVIGIACLACSILSIVLVGLNTEEREWAWGKVVSRFGFLRNK